jgi:hypothetical protein
LELELLKMQNENARLVRDKEKRQTSLSFVFSDVVEVNEDEQEATRQELESLMRMAATMHLEIETLRSTRTQNIQILESEILSREEELEQLESNIDLAKDRLHLALSAVADAAAVAPSESLVERLEQQHLVLEETVVAFVSELIDSVLFAFGWVFDSSASSPGSVIEHHGLQLADGVGVTSLLTLDTLHAVYHFAVSLQTSSDPGELRRLGFRVGSQDFVVNLSRTALQSASRCEAVLTTDGELRVYVDSELVGTVSVTFPKGRGNDVRGLVDSAGVSVRAASFSRLPVDAGSTEFRLPRRTRVSTTSSAGGESSSTWRLAFWN